MYLLQNGLIRPSKTGYPNPVLWSRSGSDNELTRTSTCLVFSDPIMVSTLPVSRSRSPLVKSIVSM